MNLCTSVPPNPAPLHPPGGSLDPQTLHPCTPRPCTSWGLCPPTPVCPILQCQDTTGCPPCLGVPSPAVGCPRPGPGLPCLPDFSRSRGGRTILAAGAAAPAKSQGLSQGCSQQENTPKTPQTPTLQALSWPPTAALGLLSHPSPPQCHQWGQMKGGSGVQDPQIGWDPAPPVAPPEYS